MDTRFNENQTELGVLVLSVTFEMLSDRDGLLLLNSNEVVEVEVDEREMEREGGKRRGREKEGRWVDVGQSLWTSTFEQAQLLHR